MTDQYGRTIDYMRISVTDRCNLRCVYCMPENGIQNIPHSEIMRYGEILRVVRAAADLGIRKIRVTGGEPLVRKDLDFLIRGIRQTEGIRSIGLTTNGVLFAQQGETLAAAGLDAVNFSLDSLDPAAFASITRRDALPAVLEGIRLSLKLGLRTKINCVPLQGTDEEGLVRIAGLAKLYPLDVRFIELMPIGQGRSFSPMGNGRVLHLLSQAYGEPRLSDAAHGSGPAVYYDFPGFKGGIGLISPISGVFCQSCNRIRLTADSTLRPCLCYQQGIRLIPLLRSGISDEMLRETLKEAIFHKPLRHNFLCGGGDGTKKMVQIGG